MSSRHFNCPSCSTEISVGSACPNCGTLLDDGVTQRFEARETPIQSPTQSYDSIDNARFVPGAILLQRYRIVGLLGKGGMGEVYRADDLKLGQAVALKFLPDHLLSDGAALARFHREVRVARQVSHKNVCRVYDIGETDGRHFLSMEYIKGEELSSLLRRIGHLPIDKSIQLARQICAGLNAAHDVGVLHRDLKPANVMIDGDGNARILDFGLAGLSEEFSEQELAAGTPAYMAPEQLEGKEQTVKTDIYSLGLVLYELFTSKKAFAAGTIGELIELRRKNTTPTSLTSLVKDLDPLIERVIERCLQTDPSLRPSSALQVAAALPGGDPIAAALAAGETPSPEMVAAAPKQGILSLRVAGSLLAAFVLLLGLGSWLTKYTALYRLSPVGDSPEVLHARARDVVKALGYSEAPADYADGFILKDDYLDYIANNDSSPQRWEKMRDIAPGPYRYWYRQSPRYFETIEQIEVNKPALDVSGMASLYLDMSGHLRWFLGVPPQREPQTSERVNADWSIPFRAADLDLKNFKTVTSTRVPLHAYDERTAWDGIDATHSNESVHVEAAAFRGKLVYFETIYPWDRLGREEQPAESRSSKVLTYMLIVITLFALFGSALLARRNLRLGRGDRRGAMRLAMVFFVVRMLYWAFAAHHNGLADLEFALLLFHLAFSVFLAVFLWLLYVALEPFVRKKWPAWIISWSRLLAGDFRDPLVGRDLLIGTVIGASLMVILGISRIAPNWIRKATPVTLTPATVILDTHLFFRRFAAQLSAGLFLAFICVFLLLVFVAVLRRERLSLITLGILITVMLTLVTQSSLIMVPFNALSALLVVFALHRYGLLALIAALFVGHLYVYFPMTTDFAAWYATDFTIALVICLVLGGYAAYTSVGGSKVFAERST